MIDTFSLIKFGAEVHMKALLERGQLHMKRAGSYADMERSGVSEGRADSWEGKDQVLQPSRLKSFRAALVYPTRREEFEIPLSEIAAPMLMYTGRNAVPHIYCMYALTCAHARKAHASDAALIDGRVELEFGQHAFVVLNVEAFAARAEAALRNGGFKVLQSLVRYVPETHHGALSPFQKHERFSFQNEYRIVVLGHESPELNLDIGSLSDIAFVASTREVLEGVRYDPKENSLTYNIDD